VEYDWLLELSWTNMIKCPICIPKGSQRRGFDDMKPEQAMAKFRELIGEMDLNNDQYITEQELTEWILENFK